MISCTLSTIVAAKVVCAHSDYLKAIDSVRSQLPGVEAFVALEGAAEHDRQTGDSVSQGLARLRETSGGRDQQTSTGQKSGKPIS
jgi:hypothetical protein